MGHRYGVSIAHYGGESWAIAELENELARQGRPILNIRGCAYPEMARAEQVRQARIAGVGVLVFIDAHVETSVQAIEELVAVAEQHGVAVAHESPWSLEAAAFSSDVLESMVRDEGQRYQNSAVDVMWGSEKVSSVPLASPWNRHGTSLEPGCYLTDSEAFLYRARRAGASVATHFPSGLRARRRRCYGSGHNLDRGMTHEPGSYFALCIPSFGTLDQDQQRAVAILERAGMTVFRMHDCPWIDIARSYLTEKALSVGKGVFFLDHDIIFDPNDVLRLCEQALDRSAVVSGAYSMRKGGRSIIGSFDVKPGPMKFFKDGETLPAYYSGLGFSAVPESVLVGMGLAKLSCRALSMLMPGDSGLIRPWYALDCSTGFYAGEDVSFTNRVHDLSVKLRDAGSAEHEPQWEMSHSGRPCRVFIDTRVRLAHRGSYDYGLEDVGIVVPRFETMESVNVVSRAEAKQALLSAGALPVEVMVEAREFPDEATAVEPRAESAAE